MKILFYRIDWGANVERQLNDSYGGVGYYRIIQPSRHLKGHEVEVIGQALNKKKETSEKRWSRVFKENDVFWTSYFYNAEEASCMFYHRDKFKKKVVIDLDDNYLNLHPTHPLYDTMKDGKRNKAFTSTILSFADVITVSTEPLKQKISEHMKKVYGLDKKIVVIPNMNQMSDWDFKPAVKDKDKVVIGYAGSNSHYDDLTMILPQVAKIMDKYPHVYFQSIGAIGKHTLNLFLPFSDEARERCDLLPPTSSFVEYPEHIAKQKWDIGIAPLVDSEFTRSKSHIKWMEYSMYQIPVIASRVYPYFMPCFGIDTIKHNETGLLVKPSEWFDALEELILNEDKRKLLGSNAFNYVKDNWQYNDSFSGAIDEVIKALK